MKVSVVVPAYNEEPCVEPLIREAEEFLTHEGLLGEWEVILVDDGSEDGTYEKARRLARGRPWLRVIRHGINLGKTKAILSGAEAARGEVIVIFDADLQYTFQDAKALADLVSGGWDLAVGWKQGPYEKKFVSWVYNRLARWLLRVPVHDMNAMKAIRRSVLLRLPLRKEWHRYIVPLAMERGYTITERKVRLRERVAGESKFRGPWRVVVGVADLVAVSVQLRVLRKPLLWLGVPGIVSFLLGILVGGVALWLRFGVGLGYRPLLYLVMLLVISGLVLITMGFLGEMIAGVYDRLDRWQG